MVTVRGPADDSDVASPHILQTLRDHVQEIESHLKSLDKAFKGSTVSVETDLPRKQLLLQMGKEMCPRGLHLGGFGR